MPIVAGTRFGRYEIRERIGSGGMGDVYRAQDLTLDRPIAIKVLPPDVARVPGRMRRFVQEAKAVSALNHPNIITIHEISEGESGQFIAIEYVDGVTLRSRMRSGRLTLPEALEIAIQTAAALTAAHAAGIVHRDIKPENIMLRPDGLVKVLDFGLAKLMQRHGSDDSDRSALLMTREASVTEAGVVVGTALYMSPEQARGIPVDARTDIFSFGVVLYEMLAGRLPFDGTNAVEMMASMITGREPQPVSRYAPEVSPDVDRMVAKTLRTDPDARYQTMKDLLVDLRSIQQGTRTVAAPRRVPARRALATASIVAALVLAVFGAYTMMRRTPAPEGIDSIAVLPFENRAHDDTVDYLSDGITESLINSLSQLPRLKVIARGSVFSYKNQSPNLAEVARKLNVRAVLTGRVLMQGDTLDVRAELTDAENNAQLWGDHFVRKAVDVFAVQDQIAHQVIDALQVRLGRAEREQVDKRYTTSTDAYQQYLQGRYVLYGGSEEAFTRAIPFFDRAIAVDPKYALAYSTRGETFFNMGDFTLPMKDAVAKAKENAETALAIDPDLADARALLANIRFQYDWQFDAAERDFRQLIRANPNHAEAHHEFTYLLAMTGRRDEALVEIGRAQQLDPINPSIVVDLQLPYGLARQYDDAIAAGRKALDLFPSFFLAHMAVGNWLVAKGDTDAGLAEIEKARAIEANPLVLGNLGYAYARAGRIADARNVLADLREASRTRYVAAYSLAVIHAALHENDEAFGLLEKAYQERSWWLAWLNVDHKVDALRSDPRFRELVRRVGLPK